MSKRALSQAGEKGEFTVQRVVLADSSFLFRRCLLSQGVRQRNAPVSEEETQPRRTPKDSCVVTVR